MSADPTIEYRCRLTETEHRVIVNALSVQIENLNRHRLAMIDTDPREIIDTLAHIATLEPYPLELIHCPYRRECPWVKPIPAT
jgi:hypothetical protein